jgi:carbonic anhydrase/acetyltransferase-like protein (isoleucine patch superfamily)
MNFCKYKEHTPIIAKTVFVDPTAKVIGQVEIAEDVSIWPMAVLRGDVNYISIGKRTNIQDNSTLHGSPDCEFYPGGYPVIIGENVTVGHNVILHGCTIGNLCLIGMGSTILDGAIIEDEVIIGAASLVPPNKTLASGYLYLGSPAKQIRPITEKEKRLLRYSADYYVELKNDFLK